jgi:hypothetical protein
MVAEFIMFESSWLFANVHGCSPRVAVTVAVNALSHVSIRGVCSGVTASSFDSRHIHLITILGERLIDLGHSGKHVVEIAALQQISDYSFDVSARNLLDEEHVCRPKVGASETFA